MRGLTLWPILVAALTTTVLGALLYPPRISAPRAALTEVVADALGHPVAAAQGDPIAAAAGDIACDPGNAQFNGGDGTASECRMKATADLIASRAPTAVLALGDLQYENGALPKYAESYDPTWGRFKAITRPVPGNHDYGIRGAPGYFTYFGTAAGDPSEGYYGFDLGAWRMIALNSNCFAVGGCGVGSRQEKWLRDDLRARAGRSCILAYWHQARFSSALHGSDPEYDAFFQDLYQAGADVLLVAHDHTYERFAPQDPKGQRDRARGIREFVVGTGGRIHYPFKTILPNSEARNRDAFGVLLLTLRPTSYDWEFVPEAGKTFTDRGSARCSPYR